MLTGLTTIQPWWIPPSATLRTGQTASLLQADESHLPYANDSFDSIVNTKAFSGYPDGHFVIAEMARVLKPDGRLIMMDINYPRDQNWPAISWVVDHRGNR